MPSGFDLNVMQEEIIRMGKDQKVDTLVRQGAYVNETANQVIAELINYSDVDYDESADLLNKLVNQALDKMKELISRRRTSIACSPIQKIDCK